MFALVQDYVWVSSISVFHIFTQLRMGYCRRNLKYKIACFFQFYLDQTLQWDADMYGLIPFLFYRDRADTSPKPEILFV